MIINDKEIIFPRKKLKDVTCNEAYSYAINEKIFTKVFLFNDNENTYELLLKENGIFKIEEEDMEKYVYVYNMEVKLSIDIKDY